MRNIQIELNSEVPKQIRLTTYKKALNYMQHEMYKVKYLSKGYYTESLAYILPCFLWKLRHYECDGPRGTFWGADEAIDAFTELKRDNHKIPELTVDAIPVQIDLLKRWIEELETETIKP